MASQECRREAREARESRGVRERDGGGNVWFGVIVGVAATLGVAGFIALLLRRNASPATTINNYVSYDGPRGATPLLPAGQSSTTQGALHASSIEEGFV
jgi:hypothetical protein